MAKTKPKDKKNKTSRKREKEVLHRTNGMSSKIASSPASPQRFLIASRISFQEGQLDNALNCAQRALGMLDTTSKDALPAITLLGEIHVELGETEMAREYFSLAATIDEEGAFGAEKFLLLAQLCEDGGQDSVEWFEKGALSLRLQIQALLDQKKLSVSDQEALEEKKRQLATALCSVVEVYMTDLSWEEDAEQKCETLVTEATLVAPEFAEPWQTLGNVRISQERKEDARAALKRSLDIWKDLPTHHQLVPDYPTRVNLARLLIDAEMDTEAMDVLETLDEDNDQSVEVCYLGGWQLYLIGEKQKSGELQVGEGESWEISWRGSRRWLQRCLALFKEQDYQDERLGAHAEELLGSINGVLGETVDGDEDGQDDEWDDIEEDEEMTEA